MARTTVVVIGAGQAGLAVSHLLTAGSVDHVVLERGRVAERWLSQRWDSLRLLTPSWLVRLPGGQYTGPEPDGYLAAREVAAHLAGYAAPAPVRTHTEVLSVCRTDDGYRTVTTDGTWSSDAVVVATGHSAAARRPPMAGDLPPSVVQPDADTYRRPGDLPDGGVLVVGASATGVQLADEIAGSGRPVTLAVGSHRRLPRHHLGRDVFWWLDRMGVLRRRRADAGPRQWREPSLQLVGRDDGRAVDLPSLQQRGVVLAGRFVGTTGRQLELADDLPVTTADADARMRAALARIDAYAVQHGLATPPGPTPVPAARTADAPTRLTVGRRGIRTVVWATGYRRSYPWLHVPVLDARGEIVHTGGRTPAPGLYVIGMAWQTRRNATTLDGVGADAALVVEHLESHLRTRAGV